jgi:hypothetical protein
MNKQFQNFEFTSQIFIYFKIVFFNSKIRNDYQIVLIETDKSNRQ